MQAESSFPFRSKSTRAYIPVCMTWKLYDPVPVHTCSPLRSETAGTHEGKKAGAETRGAYARSLSCQCFCSVRRAKKTLTVRIKLTAPGAESGKARPLFEAMSQPKLVRWVYSSPSSLVRAKMNSASVRLNMGCCPFLDTAL